MDEAGPQQLRARADRYRRLKQGTGDAQANKALDALAAECEAKADAADASDIQNRKSEKPSR